MRLEEFGLDPAKFKPEEIKSLRKLKKLKTFHTYEGEETAARFWIKFEKGFYVEGWKERVDKLKEKNKGKMGKKGKKGKKGKN